MNRKTNKTMKPETRTEVTRHTQFLDRELSQLAFNRRVMAQAEDPSIPVLERLRYLCITSSNLDEFFEVRVASLLAAATVDGKLSEHPALTANLNRVSAECHALVARQYDILNSQILPLLKEHGVHLLRNTERNEAQRAWIKDYFDREVRPLLTPIGLDPAHPFPQVVNKSLNFIVALSGKDAFGRGTAIAIIKAPRVLPRVIKLPDGLSDKPGTCFCLL
jgi:polyphosphate kinase